MLDLYDFVYDFVIFSLIDDYDGVVTVLDGFGGVKEWFQVRKYGEKIESKNSEG